MSNYIILFLLSLLGIVTGFIGTNTGGSVLVTLPVMVWLGISPQSAVATSRIASLGTMLAGLKQFHREVKVDYKLALRASIVGIIGAIIGAHVLLIISGKILKKFLGVLILVLLVVSVIKTKSDAIKNYTTQLSVPRKWFGYGLLTVVGAIGGLCGCQSKITALVFQLVFGKTISESVGTRKVSGIAIAITSLFVYRSHGIINWHFALALIFGTLIGSTVGSRYGLRKGDQWMQRLFNIIAATFGVILLFSF